MLLGIKSSDIIVKMSTMFFSSFLCKNKLSNHLDFAVCLFLIAWEKHGLQ